MVTALRECVGIAHNATCPICRICNNETRLKHVTGPRPSYVQSISFSESDTHLRLAWSNPRHIGESALSGLGAARATNRNFTFETRLPSPHRDCPLCSLQLTSNPLSLYRLTSASLPIERPTYCYICHGSGKFVLSFATPPSPSNGSFRRTRCCASCKRLHRRAFISTNPVAVRHALGSSLNANCACI